MEEEELYEQKRGGEFKERERQTGTEKEKERRLVKFRGPERPGITM